MQLDPKRCALEGYITPCSGRMTGGHILHKSDASGNPEGRAILVEQARIFMETGKAEIMAWQCVNHNVNRYANSSEAKRIQLLQKVYEFGWSHMADWFDVFLGTFKVWPTDLELERLLR